MPPEQKSTRVQRQAARTLRAMDGGEVINFATEWEKPDLQSDLYDAFGLLGSCIHSKIVGMTPGQAMLNAIATDCTDFLAALKELFKANPTMRIDPFALAEVALLAGLPSEKMLRAMLTAGAVAPAAGAEQRVGQKYSAETQDRLKAIHDALSDAHGNLSGIVAEFAPQSTDSNPGPGDAGATATVVEGTKVGEAGNDATTLPPGGAPAPQAPILPPKGVAPTDAPILIARAEEMIAQRVAEARADFDKERTASAEREKAFEARIAKLENTRVGSQQGTGPAPLDGLPPVPGTGEDLPETRTMFDGYDKDPPARRRAAPRNG